MTFDVSRSAVVHRRFDLQAINTRRFNNCSRGLLDNTYDEVAIPVAEMGIKALSHATLYANRFEALQPDLAAPQDKLSRDAQPAQVGALSMEPKLSFNSLLQAGLTPARLSSTPRAECRSERPLILI